MSPSRRITQARKARTFSLSLFMAHVPAMVAAFAEGYTTAGWVAGAIAVFSFCWNLWARREHRRARAQLGER